MTFEEQISAFMDGALTPQEETEFLHILSVSPEKRALFHSYQGVRAAMVGDARTAAVPTGLDAAILGAAGLARAIGGAAAGAAGAVAIGSNAGGAAGAGGAVLAAGSVAAPSAAFWTAGRVITAVLLGLTLFTGGWYLNDLFTPGTTESATPSVPSAPSAPPAPSRAQQTAENPATPRTGQPIPPRIVYRNIVLTRVDTVYIQKEDALAAAQPRVVTRVDTVLVALMQTAQDQRPITIVERPFEAPPISLPGKFEAEVTHDQLITWPYIDYSRIGVDRAQQHFGAALGYVFDEHHAAGISVGETSFSMEYYRVENDSLFLYQRQPALFYGAGFYRYSQPLLPGVTPEVTLLLGGCDYGPVLGARLALRFDPVEHLSFVVGANGRLLTYQYKDNLFNSHSLGLTYGIRYRF